MKYTLLLSRGTGSEEQCTILRGYARRRWVRSVCMRCRVIKSRKLHLQERNAEIMLLRTEGRDSFHFLSER